MQIEQVFVSLPECIVQGFVWQETENLARYLIGPKSNARHCFTGQATSVRPSAHAQFQVFYSSRMEIWAQLQGPGVVFVGTKTLRPDWQVSVRAKCFIE